MILWTLPPTQSAQPTVVCIDPGHPSEIASGTSGKHVSELHVNWVVAKYLRMDLEKKGITVVRVKSSENLMVRNKARAEAANKAHASLMVRLHCDSSNGTGFAVYWPDRQGTVNGFTGPSKELIQKTKPIAHRFHDQVALSLKGFLRDNGLMSDIRTAVGSKQGALTGSIYSKVPVVLIEMCVLTNRHDEELVSSEKGQKRLASALADATIAAIDKP